MPLIETKGAASAQGFGEFAKTGVATYIEDVFSTWLYTGTGAAQTITNGIDLAGKGGMLWTKGRDIAAWHLLTDTLSTTRELYSNSSSAAGSNSTVTYNSNGYNIGSGADVKNNNSGSNYVSWTFRKQPKFFDIVTYTGDGVAGRQISHSLGSVPGCIIVKAVSNANNWCVYHRSIGATGNLRLDQTIAAEYAITRWNNTEPTSTVFTVGTSDLVNQNGWTYVAYLFAHNAGGFGLTGTDNVISCGSFTTDGSGNATVTLGYEPQWLLTKRTDAASPGGDWRISDVMRNMSYTGNLSLRPNLSNAEQDLGAGAVKVSATGFTTDANITLASATYIYIAIRRGPMKTPTSGTSVFSPVARTGTDDIATITAGFPIDSYWVFNRPQSFSTGTLTNDRLRGAGPYLTTNTTAAEDTSPNGVQSFASNTSVTVGIFAAYNAISTYINYFFRRAPGFFDEVCYTGTGAAAIRNHNLGVAPELMIIKGRNFGGQPWAVYAGNPNEYLRLNTTNQSTAAADTWNYTTPTSTQFGTGTSTLVGASGWTYVAYLFASCPGVSKVGSYTGTGALQTINCGFTGGARFVLIKRTDSTGDWYVYDSARGISSGNDPYLLLNSTAAEVTGTNYVDTTSVGFQVTAAAPAGLNANGGTYIFLAIA